MVDANYKVQRGDSPWRVAQKSLQAQGKKPTNAEIQKEMQRLASVNGCKDVNDFSKKFFNSIGKNIKFTGEATGQKAPLTQPRRAKMTGQIDTTKLHRNVSLPNESTRVATPKYTPTPAEKLQTEIDKINVMKSDKQKIIAWNKKHAKGNYIIVDKKTCRATVYNKAGQALDSYEVLLGSTKGDYMSTAVDADPSQRRNTTPPGEFSLGAISNSFGASYALGESWETFDPDTERRKDAPGSGGKRKLGSMIAALHGTANPKVRNKLYGDGNLANNRVSMGCVNIPVEDIKEMEQKYGIKQGSKLYILPEDSGNSLKLERQKDGTLKFVTHYASPAQNNKRARVQEQIAQGKINRELQAKKKAAQNTHLAQQKTETKNTNFKWYNPTTWT